MLTSEKFNERIRAAVGIVTLLVVASLAITSAFLPIHESPYGTAMVGTLGAYVGWLLRGRVDTNATK